MKKYTILTILLGTFLNLIFSQSDIPRLKQQLSSSTVDSCQLLFELGKAYESIHLDSCLYFLDEALRVAQHKKEGEAIAKTMHRIGYTYSIFLRNDAKAVEWLNKALAIAKNTQDNLNLARCYQSLGAIAYYQNANNIDELLSKAISHAKASNDWQVLASTYDIMASHYIKQKRYKELEMAVFNAMTTCEKVSPDDWFSYGLDYIDILESQNRKEEAFNMSRKFANVGHKLKKTKGEFVYMIDKGRLETKLKHYATADSIFQHALSVEKAKTKPDTFKLMNTLRYAMNLAISEGNYSKTIKLNDELLEIRVAAKQSRMTKDSKQTMLELKSALELEKKNAEITLLDKQKKQQYYFLMTAVIIGVLLCFFITLLLRSKRLIEQQKIELIALNATKDRVFSLLSHDLISPIATLKNYTLLVDWGVMSQAEFIESSLRLKTNVNNLYNMLENVLNWSITQMGRSKPQFEKVKVLDVINAQIVLLDPLIKSKTIHITQSIIPNMVFEMDKNHLALIIRNLLHNALKFTHIGGTIHFESLYTEGGQKLTIRDNGMGMASETLTQLFKLEKNTQRLGTEKESGTGLGLILTKELVELNGGAITVTSELGKGTAVALCF